MRILFLSQEFPYPPDDGVRIKLYNLLSSITSEHECHILSFSSRSIDEEALSWANSMKNLKVLDIIPLANQYVIRMKQLLALFSGFPPYVGRYYSKKFTDVLNKALLQNHYDIIYIELLPLAQYEKYLKNYPTIISINDSVSRALSIQSNIEQNHFNKSIIQALYYFSEKYEKYILSHFSKVHVVSRADKDYLQKLNHKIAIKVIPIQADEKYLTPIPKSAEAQLEKTLFFNGNLSFRAISEGLKFFLKDVFSEILRQIPNIKLLVTGRNASKDIIHDIANNPNIEFCEFVENYIDAIDNSTIVVLPDLGGTGLKNRLLAAMARQKVCVCSSSVLEGFDGIDGVHYFRCDSKDEYIQTIVNVLKDDVLRRKVGIEAMAFVMKNFSSTILKDKWNHLFLEIIQSKEI